MTNERWEAIERRLRYAAPAERLAPSDTFRARLRERLDERIPEAEPSRPASASWGTVGLRVAAAALVVLGVWWAARGRAEVGERRVADASAIAPPAALEEVSVSLLGLVSSGADALRLSVDDPLQREVRALRRGAGHVVSSVVDGLSIPLRVSRLATSAQ